jgi:NDP-sugar pyrophosphorylase family protein
VQTPADITAVVLAGGLGSRLRPAIGESQKVIARVSGRPFLLLILEQLSLAGIRRAVLCVGYKAETVIQAIGHSAFGIELAYSVEPSPMGTGGALRLGMEQARSPMILAMNGDSFVKLNLHAFIAEASSRPTAMLLAHVPDTSPFGKVTLEDDGHISSFIEKSAAIGPGLVNAGIYLFDRNLMMQRIPPQTPCSIERDVFPLLANMGLLYGVASNASFHDIGTPKSLAMAESYLHGIPHGQP